MRKRSRFLILRQKIIEYKIYKRRRRKKSHVVGVKDEYMYTKSTFQFYPAFLHMLKKFGYVDANFVENVIKVPTLFELTTNYDECLLFFKQYLSSYLLGNGNIILDFSKCKTSCCASFSLLEIINLYFVEYAERYNKFRYHKCNKQIKILHSKNDIKTNKYIHSFLGVRLPQEQNDGSLFLKLNLSRGRHTTYTHNSKARISTDIVNFVNESTHKVGVVINPRGRNSLEKLLGEVLGNAEDHSDKRSYWHVDGISFLETQNDMEVVELNLCVINTGLSMYKGFEETKINNIKTYKKCMDAYNHHKTLFDSKHFFEKENLFVLYMLNDGISRLKYLDPSRGNGTTRFLQSFINLGKFGERNRNFNSKLAVLSGHTTLICDNNVGPYNKGDVLCLSLNEEKDLLKLPNPDYLKYYKSYFPGTILEIHIFLNKDYFKTILNKNENIKTDSLS